MVRPPSWIAPGDRPHRRFSPSRAVHTLMSPPGGTWTPAASRLRRLLPSSRRIVSGAVGLRGSVGALGQRRESRAWGRRSSAAVGRRPTGADPGTASMGKGMGAAVVSWGAVGVEGFARPASASASARRFSACIDPVEERAVRPSPRPSAWGGSRPKGMDSTRAWTRAETSRETSRTCRGARREVVREDAAGGGRSE